MSAPDLPRRRLGPPIGPASPAARSVVATGRGKQFNSIVDESRDALRRVEGAASALSSARGGSLGAPDAERPGGTARPGPSTRVRVRVVDVVDDERVRARADLLATEEPMEIRAIGADGERRTIAVTMRTPGRDFELAAGFLFSEGIIGGQGDVVRIDYCTDRDLAEDELYNVVTVTLARPIPTLPGLDRRLLTTSACGVCGKHSLQALHIRGCDPVPAGPIVQPEVVCSLPDRLRAGQAVFAKTGGLHAAGLFTATGDLLAVREDIGRHNAVDKIVGWALAGQMIPATGRILMVSGRASYEIMQKALVAGIPFVAAISAPSSLAVALGRDFGMTLAGFFRGRRFNVYAGQARIAGVDDRSPPADRRWATANSARRAIPPG